MPGSMDFSEWAQRWDVVLVDLTMPGLNGLKVGEQIHLQDPDVPLVLMTGWKRPSDEKVANFSEMLQKPFSISDLERCLSKAVE